MMDSTIRVFLEQTIDTPCKLHLLLIFHSNMRLQATPRQLAERSCRDIWSVNQALQELAERGVLSAAVGVGEDVHYCYTPNDDTLESICKLVRGYDDPFQRDLIQASVRELETYAAYNRRFGQHHSFAF